MRFNVISSIIKVEVGVIRQSRRQRLKTLTETLIILDITKTESNNCLIIHSRKKKLALSSPILLMSCSVTEANLEVIFLLLHRRQTTQSAQT